MSCEFELPPLREDSNKYSRGKLIVVAGSERYTGAAVLASCAAQRMGAGYTEVVTTPSAMPLVRAASPSLVVTTRSGWDPAHLPECRANRPVAVAIGSGFTGDGEESRLVKRVLKEARCPVLVDGGGLSILVAKQALGHLETRAEAGLATVVTPHQGEAARMAFDLGISYASDAEGAQLLAQALHAIVVLKGPDTYISNGAEPLVMTEGTAALAKAGTGDVLAGMIGSLLAQNMEPFQAAYAGALIHARAANHAAAHLGARSVIATDVIKGIAAIIKES